MTLLLNMFIILGFYDGSADMSESERYYIRINKPRLLNSMSSIDTNNLFSYCGIIMIVCSTFVVVFFLSKKAPLYIREAWNSS